MFFKEPPQPIEEKHFNCGEKVGKHKKKTKEILEKYGSDVFARNREISAAYANSYSASKTSKHIKCAGGIQWLALGSIVSRQVGCQLKKAKELKEGNIAKISDTVHDSADAVFKGLADGNKVIYEHLSPNINFYIEHGYEKYVACFPANKPQDKKFIKVLKNFAEGKCAEGDAGIAIFEQTHVIAPIYDTHEAFKDALEMNEGIGEILQPFSSLSGATEVAIPLSADCTNKNMIYMDEFQEVETISPNPFIEVPADIERVADYSILNTEDRIHFYEKLMSEMKKLPFEKELDKIKSQAVR